MEKKQATEIFRTAINRIEHKAIYRASFCLLDFFVGKRRIVVRGFDTW